MYSTIVFDLDGVVINSYEIQKKAYIGSYEMVYGHKNHPPFEEFLTYSGQGLDCILKEMNLSKSMIEPYRAISNANINEIRIFDGIDSLFIKLKAKNKKLAICTGKDYERTNNILEMLNIRQYFDCVMCADKLTKSKPDPEGIYTIMNVLKTTELETVMIGDSHNDILAANSAQIDSVLVGWGVTDLKAHPICKSKYVVKSVEELTNLLLDENEYGYE